MEKVTPTAVMQAPQAEEVWLRLARSFLVLVAGVGRPVIWTKCVLTLVVVVVLTSLSAGTAVLELCLAEWTCGCCGGVFVFVFVLTTFLAGLLEVDFEVVDAFEVVVAWEEVVVFAVEVETGLRCTLLEVVRTLEVGESLIMVLVEGLAAEAAELDDTLATVLEDGEATTELEATLTVELDDAGTATELEAILATELDDARLAAELDEALPTELDGARLATELETTFATELEADVTTTELEVALATELDDVGAELLGRIMLDGDTNRFDAVVALMLECVAEDEEDTKALVMLLLLIAVEERGWLDEVDNVVRFADELELDRMTCTALELDAGVELEAVNELDGAVD